MCVEALLARTRKDICDDVCANWVASNIRDKVRADLGAALSDDSESDDCWHERSDSD